MVSCDKPETSGSPARLRTIFKGTAAWSGPKRRGGKSGPRERKVLVFDEEGRLEAVLRSLKDVASITNLREKSIDRLCKNKRVSSETGYSFRYWWKVLGFDITDFTLTVSQYDALCKRKSE